MRERRDLLLLFTLHLLQLLLKFILAAYQVAGRSGTFFVGNVEKCNLPALTPSDLTGRQTSVLGRLEKSGIYGAGHFNLLAPWHSWQRSKKWVYFSMTRPL